MIIQRLRGSRRRRILGRRDFYVASPETVTPVLSAELITNGDFAAWTGDNPDSWFVGGEVGVDPMVTEVAGAARMFTSGALFYMRQNTGNVSGLWTVRGLEIVASVSGGLGSTDAITGVWWGRTVEVKSQLYLARNGATRFQVNSNSAGDITIDNITVKTYSWASLLGDVCEGDVEGHFITAWPTAPVDERVVGMVICLDDESDPQNYVAVYHDGTNVILGKWVAGIFTAGLVSAAAAWSNGAELEIKKFGTSFTVSYNGVVVGTVQTIEDVGVIGNVKCAWFTTNRSLKPSYFKHYRR